MKAGKTIRELRKTKLNQKQGEFAKDVGISHNYMSQIENDLKQPSADVMERIAKQLGIPLPVLQWKAMTEDDISKDKIELFRNAKSAVDNLISEFF